MFMLERIASVLQNRAQKESISNVEISSSDNTVFSRLGCRIGSKPYILAVTPEETLHELHIIVLSLFKLSKEDGVMLPRLFQLNLALGCGTLCIEPTKRTVYLKIQHFCENRDGPAPEFLERLLLRCVKDVRAIEHVLLFGAMLKSGLPEEKAEQLIKSIFGDDFISGWNRLVKTKKQISPKRFKGRKS